MAKAWWLCLWATRVCLVALTLAGCSTPPERGGVVIHTWRAITAGPTQPWTGYRTALYTYVLVGDVGSAAGDANAAAQLAARALKSLLVEVQAGESIQTDVAGKPWPPEILSRANQFCIPARAATAANVALQDYDLDLARHYRDVFMLVLEPHAEMARSMGSVGPFLVATRKPLSELAYRDPQGKLVIDTTSPILLIDLTGRHERAMPAYVVAFRDAVRSEVAATTSLKPLSPAFASGLLTLNEALPLVAEAYAGTNRLFK